MLFTVFESTTFLRLSQLTDHNGNTVTYTRDGQGRLTHLVDVHGRYFDVSYSSAGYVASMTDSGGRTTSYAHDGQARLTSASSPVGLTSYQYDDQNRMTKIVYPNGGVKNYAYDAQNRVVSEDDGNGNDRLSYNYGVSSTTVTDALNRNTVYRFARLGGLSKPTSITDPNGGVTSFTYDANFNLLTQTDPLGRTTHYTYDANGNVTSTQDPASGVAHASYDPTFNVPTSISDQLNHATTLSYDADGNLTQIVDPLSGTFTKSYDAMGHVTQDVDPLNHATAYTYASNNGALASVTDALGHETQLQTDPLSRVTQNTDPSGKTTQYQYDAAGNVTQVTDALGNVTHYTYDPGRGTKLLKTVTDANGHTTTFGYDDLGRVTSVTNALGQTKSSQYDVNGNLTQTTNARGQVTSYTYDSLNRLTRKTMPEGQINYTYDAAGNVTRITHYNGSSIQNSYDSLNRLTQQIQTLPNGYAATIGYTYDAAGNRLSMTTPWGNFAYQYDANNRLTQITNPQSKVFTFAYDAAGRRTQLVYPNGITTTYTYDDANRVTSIIATRTSGNVVVSSVTYTYDAAGDRRSMADWEGTHSYTYDDSHRLLGVQNPPGTMLRVQNEMFNYDSSGNRLADSRIGNYYYDSANRLVRNSSFTYSYDADGNLAEKVNINFLHSLYTFDSRNELIEAMLPGGSHWVYKYSGLGQRIEKSSGPLTNQGTQYIYDGQNVLAILDNANNPEAVFTDGSNTDESLLVHQSDADYAIHMNGLASVRAHSDMSGTVVEYLIYQAYGTTEFVDSRTNIKIDKPQSLTISPFAFTGREFDQETGLMYYRARYFDTDTGRFISIDPEGVKSGPNFYAYVDNDPINNIDPLGLYGTDPTPENCPSR